MFQTFVVFHEFESDVLVRYPRKMKSVRLVLNSVCGFSRDFEQLDHLAGGPAAADLLPCQARATRLVRGLQEPGLEIKESGRSESS